MGRQAEREGKEVGNPVVKCLVPAGFLVVGVAWAGCPGSSGEPGHKHCTLGSHADQGKFNAPSISHLFFPLKRESHLCYQETEKLEQMPLSLKRMAKRGGVWQGGADGQERTPRAMSIPSMATRRQSSCAHLCPSIPRSRSWVETPGAQWQAGMAQKSSARPQGCSEVQAPERDNLLSGKTR